MNDQMLRCLQSHGPGRRLEVPSYRKLSEKCFVTNFVRRSLPVVFKGGAGEWDCVRNWDLDFFKQNYPQQEVLIWSDEDYDSASSEAEVKKQLLADFISDIQSGEVKYARFIPLLQNHPELRDSINQTWLQQYMGRGVFDWTRFYKLFIGAAGTRTPTHNAGDANFFVQIRGQKRWRLFLTDTTPIMNPKANRTIFKTSGFDPDLPDYSRFPMARYMDYYDVILEPGDILYVPPYVWHHVTNLTPTIGVACRWTNLGNAFRASPLLAAMETFNTSPTLFGGFKMVLHDFNDVLVYRLNRNKARN